MRLLRCRCGCESVQQRNAVEHDGSIGGKDQIGTPSAGGTRLISAPSSTSVW